MKKLIFITLLAIALSLSACTGLNNNTNPSGEGDNASAPSITYDGVWPENRYTENLPVPDGTVSWMLLDEDKGYCGINLDDVDEAEYQDYMDQLQDEGFSVVDEVAEEIEGESYVSIGVILSDGTRGLSISYNPGNLGIYISLES